MQVISGHRGSGKTTELLEKISKEYEKSYVVCSDPHSMMIKAYEMGINNIRFITVDDLLEDAYANYNNIFIDSIEDFFIDIFGKDRIKGFTVNI